MNSSKLSKSKYGIFAAVSFLLITRIVLIVPVDFLGINTQYPMHYVFSFETFAYWVLLVLFSVIAAALVIRLYEIYDVLPAILSLLILFEPVFFMAQSNPLRLVVSVLGLLYAHNAISQKQIIPDKAMSAIFMFISALLLPYSVFSYGALVLAITVIVAKKRNNKETVVSVLTGVACGGAGFILNKVLSSYSEGFKTFTDAYSFADILQKSKSLEILIAFIPFAVCSLLFVNSYLKNRDKVLRKSAKAKQSKINPEESLIVPDVIITLYIIALIGFVFFDDEAFCTVNIILISMLLVMSVLKDRVCLVIFDEISCFIKKHKIITIALLLAVYYISLAFTDDYYSGEKLISYIRY